MNFTIDTDAVSEDALQLDAILRDIETCLSDLNKVFDHVIPEEVDTDWSNELMSSWEQFYKQKIAGNMEDLKNSGEALRAAVEVALGYNQ